MIFARSAQSSNITLPDAHISTQAETSLYERFLALSHEYELVSPDLLVIPFVGVKNGGSSSSSSSGDDGEEEEEEEEINPRD